MVQAGGLGQRHVCLDLVAVTAGIIPLKDVTGGGQVDGTVGQVVGAVTTW
jgi:hypothetical protein